MTTVTYGQVTVRRLVDTEQIETRIEQLSRELTKRADQTADGWEDWVIDTATATACQEAGIEPYQLDDCLNASSLR